MNITDYLRSKTGAQFFKYVICGIITVAFYVGGVWVTTSLTAFPELWINSAFYALATILGYVLNYLWSFQSTHKHSSAFPKYLAVATIGIGLNFLVVSLLTDTMQIPISIAALIFAVLWPIVSFIAQKFFVYRA